MAAAGATGTINPISRENTQTEKKSVSGLSVGDYLKRLPISKAIRWVLGFLKGYGEFIPFSNVIEMEIKENKIILYAKFREIHIEFQGLSITRIIIKRIVMVMGRPTVRDVRIISLRGGRNG